MVLEGWGELFPSLCIWREETWDELTSPNGKCKALRRELLPSPGGRWAVARLGRLPGAWIVGELLPSEQRVYSCQGRIASFPRRKVSNCRTRKTIWCLDTGRAVAFRGRVYSCRGRIASFPRRKVSNGQCMEITYSLTCRVRLTAYYLTVSLG